MIVDKSYLSITLVKKIVILKYLFDDFFLKDKIVHLKKSLSIINNEHDNQHKHHIKIKSPKITNIVYPRINSLRT